MATQRFRKSQRRAQVPHPAPRWRRTSSGSPDSYPGWWRCKSSRHHQILYNNGYGLEAEIVLAFRCYRNWCGSMSHLTRQVRKCRVCTLIPNIRGCPSSVGLRLISEIQRCKSSTAYQLCPPLQRAKISPRPTRQHAHRDDSLSIEEHSSSSLL